MCVHNYEVYTCVGVWPAEFNNFIPPPGLAAETEVVIGGDAPVPETERDEGAVVTKTKIGIEIEIVAGTGTAGIEGGGGGEIEGGVTEDEG